MQITDHPAIQQIKDDLAEIEMDVLTSFTLADAIREGSSVTDQAHGTFVEQSGNVCALSAAFISAKARGFIQ